MGNDCDGCRRYEGDPPTRLGGGQFVWRDGAEPGWSLVLRQPLGLLDDSGDEWWNVVACPGCGERLPVTP